MMTTRYDAIILGAGQAGPPLAGRLTEAGMKVALVERKLFGGTCVNTGCMPTKALVASAYAAHMARRASDYGIGISGPITIDMAKVKARKDAVTMKARHGVESWLKGMKGCTVYEGQARFTGPKTINVGDDELTADRIFLNVGGRALLPDMPGVDHVRTLTNTSILELDHVPEHLVVIGGSYIGLEFGQMYRRFGSKVTLVEKGPRLVQREDEDVSAAIQSILEAEGIDVRLHAECIHFKAIDGNPSEIDVGLDCHAGEPVIRGSHVLLAVGRRPNTDDLGLDVAGVATDARGYVTVDDELRTNVPGIWAMGDCNGKGAFTHTSYNDFEIVAANLTGEEPRRVSDRIETYGLFIDPPLGRCGMTEAQAKKAGHEVRIGTRPMTRVGRANEKGENLGFMKIIVDGKTDEILGASILGVGGDEAVHSILDLMYAKKTGTATATTLRHSVQIHPTVCELIPTMLGELKPSA